MSAVLSSPLVAPAQWVDRVDAMESGAASQWVRAHGYGGLLKLTANDFVLAAVQPDFWHINAAPCAHAPGRRYAITPLTSSQARGDARTTVDTRYAIEAVCTERLEFARLSDVPVDLAVRLIGMGGLEGRDQVHVRLVALMVERYAVLRGWCADNAADLPVVIGRFSGSGLRLAKLFDQAGLLPSDAPQPSRRPQRSLGFHI